MRHEKKDNSVSRQRELREAVEKAPLVRVSDAQYIKYMVVKAPLCIENLYLADVHIDDEWWRVACMNNTVVRKDHATFELVYRRVTLCDL